MTRMKFKFESISFPPFCRKSHLLNVNKSQWIGRRDGKAFLEDLEMSLMEELELVSRVSGCLSGGGAGRRLRTEDTKEWEAKWNVHRRVEGSEASEMPRATSLWPPVLWGDLSKLGLSAGQRPSARARARNTVRDLRMKANFALSCGESQIGLLP